MDRRRTLELAANAILNDRQKTHGSPENNFAIIAGYWNQHLLARNLVKPGGEGLGAADVAVMMALMKIGRIEGNPSHEDNWVDAVGYLACGSELIKTSEASGAQGGEQPPPDTLPKRKLPPPHKEEEPDRVIGKVVGWFNWGGPGETIRVGLIDEAHLYSHILSSESLGVLRIDKRQLETMKARLPFRPASEGPHQSSPEKASSASAKSSSVD